MRGGAVKSTHRSNIQGTLDISAKATERHLDEVWKRLFPGRRPPRTWLDRNQMIYAELGYIPPRHD